MTYSNQPNGQWHQPQNSNQQPFNPQYSQQRGPQRQMSVTVDLGAVTSKLSPRIVSLASGILFLLTAVTYMFKWRSPKGSGYGGDMSVNGFGIQKVTYDGDTIRGLASFSLFFGLVVVFLILAAAILTRFTNYQKIAGLLLAIGGGLSTLYSFIGLFSDLGMTRKFLGSDASMLDFGVSYGVFLALLVGLVTLALGVLYLLAARGPLLPPNRTSVSPTETTPFLRPAVLAAASAGLLVLLVISYLLNWRTTGSSGDSSLSLSINGLTVRESSAGGSVSSADVSLLGLWPAVLFFLAIANGALLIAVTAFRKLGATLILGAGVLSFINTLYAMVTDFGLFREAGNLMSTFGVKPDTHPAFGAFFAAVVSIALIAVSVLYLVKGTTTSPQSEPRSTEAPTAQPAQPMEQPAQPHFQDNADAPTTQYRPEPRHSQQPQTPSDNSNGPQTPPSGTSQGRWS